LFLILFIFYAAVHFNPVQDQGENPAFVTAVVTSERSVNVAGKVECLLLTELIHRVVAQNQQIQIQKTEWDFSSAYK
jgi:hypothetical protein